MANKAIPLSYLSKLKEQCDELYEKKGSGASFVDIGEFTHDDMSDKDFISTKEDLTFDTVLKVAENGNVKFTVNYTNDGVKRDFYVSLTVASLESQYLITGGTGFYSNMGDGAEITYITITIMAAETQIICQLDYRVESIMSAKFDPYGFDYNNCLQVKMTDADQGQQLFVDRQFVRNPDVSGEKAVIGQTINSLGSITDYSITYINCTLSVTLNGGIYYFINCNGSIKVSGTVVKIYVTDSPNLTINGITSDNWINIFIDGVANYSGMTRFLNGIQILKGTEYNNQNAPSEKTVTLPISFVSNDYTIALAPNIPDTDYKFYKAMPAVEHVSASQFKLKFVSFDGNDQVSPAVDYVAIGKWK